MAVLVSCLHCLDLFPTTRSDGEEPVHCGQCGKPFFLTNDVCAETSIWFVLRGSKQFGPYPLSRLRELVEQNRVQPTDQLARVGARPRLQAGSLQALFPQEDVTPPPRSRATMGDSDELMIYAPASTPHMGPLSQDGIRGLPHRTLTPGDSQILHSLAAG